MAEETTKDKNNPKSYYEEKKETFDQHYNSEFYKFSQEANKLAK